MYIMFLFLIQLATGRWFSLGTLVSSTKKTDNHNITEILLKVALNTITLTLLLLMTNNSDRSLTFVLQFVLIVHKLDVFLQQNLSTMYIKMLIYFPAYVK